MTNPSQSDALSREEVERIRAVFRCFSEDDEQKVRLDKLCNMALAFLSTTQASVCSERVMGGIVSTPGARSGTRTDAQAEVMPSCVQPATERSLSDKRIEEIAGEAYLAWVHSSDKNPRWALERAIRAALLEVK